MAQKPKHILVIRLSAMGDVAMCVPVLQVFRQQHPEVEVTVLTKAFFKPIFEQVPGVSVRIAKVKTEHKGLGGLVNLATTLRKEVAFDAVADLHNVLRTKILGAVWELYGINSVKINKGRSEKKALTVLKKKSIKALQTTHQRYAEVFENLGYPIDLSLKTDKKKLELPAGIKEVLDSKKKWIGFAPFAAHQAKMYPLDLSEKIIGLLAKNPNYEIILFGGGKEETSQLKKLAENYKSAYFFGEECNFEEELQAISNLELMLSMDSGNGHLAAMFQVPVITLWGATHPYAGFAPFGQSAENQFLPDREKYPLLPTSIYGNKEVADYENVMRDIEPEKVVKRIKEIVE